MSSSIHAHHGESGKCNQTLTVYACPDRTTWQSPQYLPQAELLNTAALSNSSQATPTRRKATAAATNLQSCPFFSCNFVHVCCLCGSSVCVIMCVCMCVRAGACRASRYVCLLENGVNFKALTYQTLSPLLLQT